MEMDNFFKICVFFTVGMMVFTLVINFLVGLGIFGPITITWGADTGVNQSGFVENITQTPTSSMGFGDAFLLVFGAGTAFAVGGAIAIAIATQNATFVGIYVFSVYFWASYLNSIGILGIGGFVPASFIALFTIPIGFIFVGAIIGMLSGT